MAEVVEHTVASNDTPEVQAQAEKIGWIPPARFKGDPERFVDASLYIERGETVLPIVREHNRRLQEQVVGLQGEVGATKTALKAAQAAIEQIEERHTVSTQKAVERARAEVKAQLAAASEAGDHQGVADLTEQLVDLNQALPEPVKKQVVAPAAQPLDPELVTWMTENPWFEKDKRKTALALGIASELRDGGFTAKGRVFFDKVKEELDAMLSPSAPRGDKVDGARGGAEGEGRSAGGKKGYAALPADAKVACDADGKRFVGEGKKYKTSAEWRDRYATLYFGDQS